MMNIPHLPSDFLPLAPSFCRSGFILLQSAISAIAFLPTELIITNDLHKLSIFAILYDIIWQNFLRRKNSAIFVRTFMDLNFLLLLERED